MNKSLEMFASQIVHSLTEVQHTFDPPMIFGYFSSINRDIKIARLLRLHFLER